MTPLFLVFVAIGSTDLLFALDSIPAVFGVTQNPFVVFSANAFALLGLRALYFLIEGLLQRLVYLTLGLAVILAFIGVKLIPGLPARRRVDGDTRNPYPPVPGGDPRRAGHDRDGEPAARAYPFAAAGARRRAAGTWRPRQAR